MASHFFPTIEGDVASIFLSYFERAPEFEAMQHYVGVYQALQADPAAADNAFNLLAAHIYADGVASQEVPAGPTVSDAWYVNYLYSNILGRAPDAEGQQYWTAQLASGAIERAELVGTFIAAALAASERDEAYLTNRTEVAVAFSQWENSNPQVLPTLQYDAAEVLLGVNENDATVIDALGRLETSTGPIGETRNLTPGIDTFEGTTGNDTFNAVFQSDNASDSTLTSFDTIDGNLGIDTLNIYVGERVEPTDDDLDAIDDDIFGPPGANAVFPSTASVRNIEIIKVFNAGDAEDSLLDLDHYQGVEEFWQIGSEGSVSNVGDGVLLGFTDIDDYLAANVALAPGVSAAQLELSNVGTREWIGSAKITGRDLDTVNISGSGVESAFGLSLSVDAGARVSALTINTAVNTSLLVWSLPTADSVAPLIHRLDLSGSTGNIVFDINWIQALSLPDSNEGLNVAFGSGDDTIIFDARDLALRDNIDGGAGYDSAVLMYDGKVQTQSYDAIARLQNFDQLIFGGSNVDLNAAALADFDLKVQGSGVVTVRNLATGQDLTIASSMEAGTIPYQVVLQNATADVAVTMEQAATFLAIGSAVGGKAGTLAVDGGGALFFDNSTSGKFSVIDTSSLEGWKVEAGADLPVPGVHVDGEVSLGLMLLSMALTFTDHGANAELQGSGMSGEVAETVILNPDTLDLILLNIDVGSEEAAERGLPDIPWYTSNSSTYGKMDVLVDFNSDAANGPLDYLAGPAKLHKIDLHASDTTQQLAFQTAAQAYAALREAATDDIPFVVYFLFNGDTYVFADTLGGDTGQYDNSDFALKIVGEHQLENVWVASLMS